MKKAKFVLLLSVLAILLSACGGTVTGVEIVECESNLYTQSEIRDAIDEALDYFRREFSGCTLTDIGYAGDEKNQGYSDWATRNGGDDVIVLVSSFDVGPSGGDGSLNPNGTYTGWKWILIRERGGKWRHMDHGYG